VATNRGLFARLATGEPRIKNAAADVSSIVVHLRYLLNTRIGDALTAPDYGIEDLSDLTTSFPEATDIWRRSIRTTIEKYEPRLTNVRVNHVAGPNPLRVYFTISARLTENKAPVELETAVDTTGQFEIW
jgi:type VI secretion system protein